MRLAPRRPGGRPSRVLLGERTITTVGSKITKLTPSRSFAVQLGTAVAVLSSTVLGLAVSTSHCLVGAIIGIGLTDRLPTYWASRCRR